MIQKSFIELKKLCKNFDFSNGKKVVLMGDCATQHIAEAIRGCSVYKNMPLNVIDIDYNQIESQVIDENSELYLNNPEFVIICMCSEMLYKEYCESQNKENFAEVIYEKIINFWNRINQKINTKILQFNFVEKNDMAFGNYGLKTNVSFIFQVKKLNYLLACGFQEYKNVFPIDINSIQNKFGNVCDDKLYYTAKLPFSLTIIPEIANSVTSVIMSILGRFKKCIICDLDNTLWGGVIGDDGLSGIQIGDLGLGHAFEDLQRWLKVLKERGIILGICSKNNEEIAKEPFLKHPEMILKLDDISIFVANWEDKATNIKYIQQVLNIGMDSIVFIDDNPFERNLVKSLIPEITVPELPEDPSLYTSYLRDLNLFETASYSENDKDRTSQYQSEIKRVESEKHFENFDDYLKDLDMIAESKPFDEFQTPRIAQLTQRSNQFNFRTIRCTEEDIKKYSQDKDYITRYFTLQDRFGDHGLISVLLLKKMDNETLFVENWLMSCRVLKRGMEEFIVNEIATIAEKNNFKYVIGEYIPTPKNMMVSSLYEKLGFSVIEENKFRLDVNKYIKNKTFINKKEEN